MWELFTRKLKRPFEAPQSSRNVRPRLVPSSSRNVWPRLVFEGTTNATLGGFENLWTLPMDTSTDLSEAGSLFADDAYIRKEYVELYDLIRTELAKKQWGKSAIVRGSSGTGKSAFLQYVISRIRDEVRDVLVVQGQSHNHNQIRYLHLSTTWWGQKIATKIKTYEDACEVEKNCSWTVVDGCDWTPANNFTIGAASPSTPWKGFLKANCLELCMPLWPLDQLQDCPRQKSSDITDDKLETLNENYELIGGIARWAFN
jgi:hypothetical protein